MTSIMLAAISAAVLVTSTISGVFGMAGGLILLGLLLAVLPVGTAIAVQGAIQIVANGSRAWFSRAFIDWRILGVIILGLLVAALLLLLLRYSPDLIVVCISLGLVPILVWIPRRWLALDASRPLHAFVCGLCSGGLNLAVGASGPVIDIFFIRTEMDRRTIIATKAAAQVVAHGAKALFYGFALTGVTAGDWLIVLIAAPFAVGGTQLGYMILQKLSDARFRSWTRLVVTAIGLFYLLRGLSLLLAA